MAILQECPAQGPDTLTTHSAGVFINRDESLEGPKVVLMQTVRLGLSLALTVILCCVTSVSKCSNLKSGSQSGSGIWSRPGRFPSCQYYQRSVGREALDVLGDKYGSMDSWPSVHARQVVYSQLRGHQGTYHLILKVTSTMLTKVLY